MSNAGSGDRLARGAASAQFSPATGISKEKWNDIFEGFDPESYRRDAVAEKTRNAGTGIGETGDSKTEKPIIPTVGIHP